jgi:hypothetical protein
MRNMAAHWHFFSAINRMLQPPLLAAVFVLITALLAFRYSAYRTGSTTCNNTEAHTHTHWRFWN